MRAAPILTSVILLSSLAGLPGQAPAAPTPLAKPLKVLVVDGGAADKATAFAGLLAAHRIKAVIKTWADASPEAADKHDLVLVLGPGGRSRPRGAPAGYRRPILGVGPYGCRYFGQLKLKNGHPYT